jgi:hypothetical protein
MVKKHKSQQNGGDYGKTDSIFFKWKFAFEFVGTFYATYSTEQYSCFYF